MERETPTLEPDTPSRLRKSRYAVLVGGYAHGRIETFPGDSFRVHVPTPAHAHPGAVSLLGADFPHTCIEHYHRHLFASGRNVWSVAIVQKMRLNGGLYAPTTLSLCMSAILALPTNQLSSIVERR